MCKLERHVVSEKAIFLLLKMYFFEVVLAEAEIVTENSYYDVNILNHRPDVLFSNRNACPSTMTPYRLFSNKIFYFFYIQGNSSLFITYKKIKALFSIGKP